MDLKNNVAELIFVFWQDFINIFFRNAESESPLSISGDIINENREDGKTSPRIEIK